MYKKIDFHGKIVNDAAKSNKSTGSSYLNLPADVKMFSIKENVAVVLMDFVPYIVSDPHHPCRNEESELATPNTLYYRRPYAIHRQIGENNETVVCPTSIGKKCPICEYQLKMFKETGPTTETKKLRAKQRDLYVVIPIESKDHDEVPYILDMARSTFQDILAEELKLKPRNELFFTLDEGKTAEVTFKWKQIEDVTYPEARSINFLDSQPYGDDVLNMIPDLDKILKIKSYEELHNMFYQVDEAFSDDLKEVPNNEPVRERKSIRDRSLDEHKEEKPAPEERERKSPEPEKRSIRGAQKEMDPEPERRSIRRAPDEGGDKETHEPERRTIARRNAEEKPVDEKSERRTAKPAGDTGADKEKDKCPFGHRFGVDTAEFKDCDACSLYDDCDEELIRRKKANAK